jgi:hypothetical protein
MLALDASVGDIAIRKDTETNFILRNSPASVLENWIELEMPEDVVTSVNGKNGIVELTTADIEESSNLYYTEARATLNFNNNFDTIIPQTSISSLLDGNKVLMNDQLLEIDGGDSDGAHESGTLFASQQQMRDVLSNWTTNNPVLKSGVIGIEIGTNKFKIGDGSTEWNDLGYSTDRIDSVVDANTGRTYKFWIGLQADYDSITTKDDYTIYMIK